MENADRRESSTVNGVLPLAESPPKGEARSCSCSGRAKVVGLCALHCENTNGNQLGNHHFFTNACCTSEFIWARAVPPPPAASPRTAVGRLLLCRPVDSLLGLSAPPHGSLALFPLRAVSRLLRCNSSLKPSTNRWGHQDMHECTHNLTFFQ